MRDENEKSVHPASRKPEKAAWQKWVSRCTENPKGRSRQKLGIKRKTMSHWSLCIRNPVSASSSNGIDQSASPSTRSSSDETLGVIKAIAELKPSGSFIFHTAVSFSFVQNLYKLFWSAAYLLLGRQPLVHKNAYFQAIQKSIKIYLQLNVPSIFLFSVLFCEERPRFNLWCMHWQ